MILTYRYRVKNPGPLPAVARSVNYVWNYCGDVQNYRRSRCRRWPTAFDLIQLTRASKELGLHSDAIAAVCLHFARSRDHLKRRPGWRVSAGSRRSLGWVPFNAPRAIRLDGQAVIFQKRRYRLWMHRPVSGTIKCGSFAEDSRGRWYLNLQCEVKADQPCGKGTVGIDLGLKTLASLSDGTKIDRRRITAQYERHLAIAQRAGRTRRVRAIHANIANTRKDYLHRCSTAIARQYQHVIVGNVNAVGLAKTRLAKSVLDAGWSAFRAMLRYKMAMRPGATYVEVDENGSTQRCSECGALGGPQGIAALGVREWVCGACGALHDRDLNAAHNLLLSGQNAGLLLTESLVL